MTVKTTIQVASEQVGHDEYFCANLKFEQIRRLWNFNKLGDLANS